MSFGSLDLSIQDPGRRSELESTRQSWHRGTDVAARTTDLRQEDTMTRDGLERKACAERRRGGEVETRRDWTWHSISPAQVQDELMGPLTFVINGPNQAPWFVSRSETEFRSKQSDSHTVSALVPDSIPGNIFSRTSIRVRM